MSKKKYTGGIKSDRDRGEAIDTLLHRHPNKLKEWTIDGELISFRTELPITGDVRELDLHQCARTGEEGAIMLALGVFRFFSMLGCRVIFAENKVYLCTSMPDWLFSKMFNFLKKGLLENSDEFGSFDMQIPKAFGVYLKRK